MKTLTFTVPCYNSAEYMDKCLDSLIHCSDDLSDIQIIIVDDGSTDGLTPEKADQWERAHPETILTVHKPNGGHGSAVNAGLAHAEGCYFKVVDSDDWIDDEALAPILAFLREQSSLQEPCDLVIGNYVYEKVHENISHVMDYTNVFPEGRIFTWDDIRRFRVSQYLLMHSVIYRTGLLLDMGLKLPEHCFYVDNIFVYEPLPHVHTLRYFNEDMYRYYIGREGQSINEATMLARIDQQLKVTRILIDSVDLTTQVPERKLRRYMESYLSMMMCICTVFLRMENTDENEQKLRGIWGYLKEKQPDIYMKVRSTVLNLGTNLPTKLGRKIGLTGYHIAQKLFGFN